MIPEIIAAITAANTDFVTIDHALSMEPVENLESEAPAFFVLEGDGKGLDEEGDACVENVEVRSVKVFIVCKWIDLELYRNQTKAVLRGFQFKPEQRPLKLASSRTIKINGEYLWREDVYTTVDYS